MLNAYTILQAESDGSTNSGNGVHGGSRSKLSNKTHRKRKALDPTKTTHKQPRTIIPMLEQESQRSFTPEDIVITLQTKAEDAQISATPYRSWLFGSDDRGWTNNELEPITEGMNENQSIPCQHYVTLVEPGKKFRIKLENKSKHQCICVCGQIDGHQIFEYSGGVKVAPLQPEKTSYINGFTKGSYVYEFLFARTQVSNGNDDDEDDDENDNTNSQQREKIGTIELQLYKFHDTRPRFGFDLLDPSEANLGKQIPTVNEKIAKKKGLVTTPGKATARSQFVTFISGMVDEHPYQTIRVNYVDALGYAVYRRHMPASESSVSTMQAPVGNNGESTKTAATVTTTTTTSTLTTPSSSTSTSAASSSSAPLLSTTPTSISCSTTPNSSRKKRQRPSSSTSPASASSTSTTVIVLDDDDDSCCDAPPKARVKLQPKLLFTNGEVVDLTLGDNDYNNDSTTTSNNIKGERS